MKVIDAHQHFWIYDAIRDNWIDDEMKDIKKDFLPADLEIILKENNINGSIIVQSNQSEKENVFQLKNAEQFNFIKGVVGWVDLQAEDVEGRLVHYKQYKKFKGFRHVLQGERQRDLMLDDTFKRGIGLLNQHGFTYDLLILPDQLKYAKSLAAIFPEQLFVIDHMAKPDIKNKKKDEWPKDIASFSGHENVYCKISGMVTEADWNNWKKDDFKPYLDAVVNSFGTKRIMYGSDWPVCLIAASYKKMKDIVDDYFSSFTTNEQEDFFGKNAIEFYHL
jgi:L-fuconolactonase